LIARTFFNAAIHNRKFRSSPDYKRIIPDVAIDNGGRASWAGLIAQGLSAHEDFGGSALSAAPRN
jgi:hypothetical protein